MPVVVVGVVGAEIPRVKTVKKHVIAQNILDSSGGGGTHTVRSYDADSETKTIF